MGPCAAGTAYIPGLADFVPMVKGHRLDGPGRAAPDQGRDRRGRDPGGAGRLQGAHAHLGVGDLVGSDEECIQAIRDYLSFFPQSCEPPPKREPADPVERMDEHLDVLPDSPRKPYDMYDVIRRIVDDGFYFDIERFMLIILPGADGRPACVGIVTNQPKQLGGILENDSADKAARFINLCDAYGIPLLFLQDVPSFMVERGRTGGDHPPRREDALRGLARDNAEGHRGRAQGLQRLLRDVRQGLRAGPDRGLALAEISVMGPEGAVNIIFRKQIEAADDPDATRAEMIDGIRKTIDPYIAAGNALIDDVIDPRETRPTVIRALEMATRSKRGRDPGSACR